jgi:hypothetical protein
MVIIITVVLKISRYLSSFSNISVSRVVVNGLVAMDLMTANGASDVDLSGGCSFREAPVRLMFAGIQAGTPGEC